MSFYAISGLINAVTSTLLGFLVYFKNKKVNINRIFTLFCLSIAIWGYAYFVWQISTTKETALFWSRTLMVGAIFMPITYFHFITVFLNIHRKKKNLLVLGYILSFIFLILNLTPLFVKNVEPELFFPYWPKPGIAYHPFLLMFFIFFLNSFYLLYKALPQATEILQAQIKYLLVGSVFGFFGGATNYFLWYDIPIPPFGSILITFFTILTALAITKYQLFNIKVILTELLVALVAVILLIDLLLSDSLSTTLLKLGIFLAFVYLGVSLIKSVLKEIERRTELENLTNRLKRANTRLKELDEAKSEFVSIASHQLRTPLTAIKGYISLINEKIYGRPPKRMKKPLDNIYVSTERLIKLVGDLLNISRIEAGKIKLYIEKLQLEDIIDSVVSELKNLAKEKKLYLKWEKPKKSLPKVLVDKDRIRQVILNVIDNAIRYTERGGVTIRYRKGNKICKLIISDTGEGMIKKEMLNLFRSFTRGSIGQRTWTEGTGLGLYIAKKFLDLHNGKIWAKSPGKGKGSTFYIELPTE